MSNASLIHEYSCLKASGNLQFGLEVDKFIACGVFGEQKAPDVPGLEPAVVEVK